METAAAGWQALGTWVRVVVTGDGDAAAARRAVEALLDAVDRACSRFRDDSELGALNRAEGRWLEVSPLLLEALEAALWAAATTGGAVDPTVGRALRTAGYDRDFAAVPSSGAPTAMRHEPVPGWRAVELDRAPGRARLAPGVEVDLGSTAKALAADRAAPAARAAARASGALVSLGGDIAVAGRPPGNGWPVLVAEDCSMPVDAEGEVVLIADGGLATSSTRARRWTRGGVELHHIIDPATGAPARGPWRTATAAAESCLAANAAATAAIVMGARAADWLEERGLPARLVGTDGSVVTVGGWPEER
ncbi:MAG TPA: FAD:protein FMN transferase [Candidatus Dormibacteraeota bacterium]|nr:FAD:protein FMN transferase [Candidatus Dormibacteraeota bacterium]